MMISQTIVQCLLAAAQKNPEGLAFRYLVDGDETTEELDYQTLLARASGLACILADCSTPGDRVLLLCAPGLDSVVALYACFAAGLVAVPVSAPHASRIKGQSARLKNVIADCSPSIIIATSDLVQAKPLFVEMAWEFAVPKWIAIDANRAVATEVPASPRADDLAVLQYTSGSTSVPKGVMLSHRNLIANQNVIGEIAIPTHPTGCLSWLPYFHDMGLSFYILPVFLGIPCTLMSPMHFMQHPMRWVRALSRYRCSGTAAPNFALELVAERFSPERDGGLDLRHLRALIVGAEPVRARTLERFNDVFGEIGFRGEAFFPCFGMAESTLISTHGSQGAPTIRAFETDALSAGRVVAVPLLGKAVLAQGREFTELVGNGAPGEHHDAIVVDPRTGKRAAADRVGEIWLCGPSIGQGYWRRPKETAETFAALTEPPDGRTYLRTGDLGFFHEGELFLTGRIKDLIIVRGRNLYPDDIEEIVRLAHPSVGEGVAAFEMGAETKGIGVLLELKKRKTDDAVAIARDVRQAVSARLEAEVFAVGIVAPLNLPRTSSGKIQRSRAKQLYESETLPLVADWRADRIAQTA